MTTLADGTVVESATELEPDVRTALRRHVVTLADSKRILGIRYSDWTLGAPSLEADIAITSMAQDEWGHARLLYALLKEFDEDPTEVEHARDGSAYASLGVLDDPFPDWAAVVAAMVVVDGALVVALDGFGRGAWDSARSRVPKMVAEEGFHADLGRAWFRRLADGTEASRARLAEAVDSLLPATLAWLAPEDGPFGLLVARGLVEPGADMVERLGDRIGATLGLVGRSTEGARADRSGWDVGRGRGPGRPAEEAVERARGDRNRALFVE